MTRRQQLRAEETKQAILTAAGQLFSTRGFDAVTMREIAKEAGCSHTTIYIYFKDKEALLHQLAMGPLQWLQEQMEAHLQDQAITPAERLKLVTRVFIRFCLENRTMYHVLFMAQATRVDEAEPDLEVNRLRNYLFALLTQTVQACIPKGQPESLALAYARIFFYTLHGIIGLYTNSPEPLDQLLERLGPTFDLATTVMVAGFQQNAQTGGEQV